MLPAPSTAIFVRAGRAAVCDRAAFPCGEWRVLIMEESPLDAGGTRAGRGFADALKADYNGVGTSGSATAPCGALPGTRRSTHYRCAAAGATARREARMAAKTLGSTMAVAMNIAVISSAAVSFWLSPPK